MSEFLTAREGLEQLLDISESDIDLLKVATKFTPDHAHWKEEKLSDGTKFETGPDLLDWFHTKQRKFYYGSRVARKLGLTNLSSELSLKKLSLSTYERYFADKGIEAEIDISGNGLFDYHTGALLTSHQHLPRWNVENTARLFPEVDFRVSLVYPEANRDQHQMVGSYIYIDINTTRVGIADQSRYRIHLAGHSLTKIHEAGELITPTNKEVYLQTIDEELREWGIEKGVERLVIARHSTYLFQAIQKAVLPKVA